MKRAAVALLGALIKWRKATGCFFSGTDSKKHSRIVKEKRRHLCFRHPSWISGLIVKRFRGWNFRREFNLLPKKNAGQSTLKNHMIFYKVRIFARFPSLKKNSLRFFKRFLQLPSALPAFDTLPPPAWINILTQSSLQLVVVLLLLVRKKHPKLGGWTDTLVKIYAPQIGSFPQIRVKVFFKKMKPPPVRWGNPLGRVSKLFPTAGVMVPSRGRFLTHIIYTFGVCCPHTGSQWSPWLIVGSINKICDSIDSMGFFPLFSPGLNCRPQRNLPCQSLSWLSVG